MKKLNPAIVVPICIVAIVAGIFIAIRSSGLGPEPPAPPIQVGTTGGGAAEGPGGMGGDMMDKVQSTR